MLRKVSCVVTVLLFSVSLFSLVLTVLPANVRATTLYVGGVGPGNYTTIQQAVDAASPGDEVFVYGGTYFENVRVLKSLSLIGEDKNTTVIDGSGAGDVLDIYASSVSIAGFTITNSGRFISDSGINLYNVSNCYIANNNISSNNNYGIFFYFSSNSLVINNFFSDSSCSGIHISMSSNITLEGNMMEDDGIRISGSSIEEWNSHTIDTSNTVNLRPIYYIKNALGGTVPPNAGQVILANATNVVVENQDISRTSVGILVGFSSDVTVSSNDVSSNHAYGILLDRSNDNTVTNNVAYSNNRDGIRLERSSRNVVRYNEVNMNVESGISLVFDCSDNSISYNNASNEFDSVELGYSDNNIIANNTIHSSGNGNGILFSSSENNTILDNNISAEHSDGIWLITSDNTTIEGNTIFSHFGTSILVVRSNNNVIVDNNILSNIWFGIRLSSSVNNTISNNIIEDGISIAGVLLEEWNTHNIDLSNTVNSKPIYYWKNIAGGSVPTGAGQIILANCSDVRVENQAIGSTSNAITLGFSSQNTISNNTVWWNRLGIHLYEAHYNVIINNNVSSNDIMGFQIDYSANNTIRNNTMWDNWGHSAYLRGSVDNRIYHNNFIDNSQMPYDNADANEWDNGYPSGGNYWDDYAGSDAMSGPNQDMPGSDGIGDSPYVIDSNSNDDYPLMSPVGFAPPIPSPPSEPRNLQAQAGDQQVMLAWEPPASDGDSPVTNYVIYRGGSTGARVLLAKIGTDLMYTDTEVGNGQPYYYQVSGVNAMGEGARSSEASATPTAPPINQPPTCSIIVPESGEIVSGVYTIIGSSSDSDGTIEKVEVKIDEGGWTLATGATSWSYDWDTSVVPNGIHTAYARSFDGTTYSFEMYVYVTIENPPPAGNEPPTTSITSPMSGATISDTFTIEGTSQDSDGTVWRTEIRIDDGAWLLAFGGNSWGIELNTTDLKNGGHTIYARSYDGAHYSSIVHVDISVNNPTSDEPDDWLFVAAAVSIIIIVVVMLLYVFFKKRRIKEEKESIEPSLEEEAETTSEEEG